MILKTKGDKNMECKKIKKVYMLYHINERKDEKLIGFLSSKEKAENIIKELVEKPGLKDCLNGIKIKTMIIGKDYYTKGFKSKCAPKDE